jgi:hypothetical protein
MCRVAESFSARPLTGTGGHLDLAAVIERMTSACPRLLPLLGEDADVIGDLPYLQVSWIAKGLVEFGREGDQDCVRLVPDVAEQVLRDFGQEGRDFIGAGFVEGIPDGGESLLSPVAGPLLLELMGPYLSRSEEVSGLELLWIDNWWDAPLAGVVRHQGSEQRFQAIWDPRTDDWTSPRVFWLFEMTEEERHAARARHRLFEEKVGTVYCFHPGVERGVRRPEETHHEFYDRFSPRDTSVVGHRRAIGWFKESALGDFQPKRPG